MPRGSIGRRSVVAERTPDLAVLDLQIGSMGGMAIAMALRLDESGGLLPHVKVLMLLDRVADVHLAQRSGAEGWLIKPLDALRLKRASLAVANDEIFQEGVPVPAPPRRVGADRARRSGNARGRTSTRRIGSLPATGCSAAWLACHVRDVEAGGSNPLTPTKCPAEEGLCGPVYHLADLSDP